MNDSLCLSESPSPVPAELLCFVAISSCIDTSRCGALAVPRSIAPLVTCAHDGQAASMHFSAQALTQEPTTRAVGHAQHLRRAPHCLWQAVRCTPLCAPMKLTLEPTTMPTVDHVRFSGRRHIARRRVLPIHAAVRRSDSGRRAAWPRFSRGRCCHDWGTSKFFCHRCYGRCPSRDFHRGGCLIATASTIQPRTESESEWLRSLAHVRRTSQTEARWARCAFYCLLHKHRCDPVAD
jgi:hypothetical protein